MSDDTLLHLQELLESAQASLKTASALLREVTGVSDVARERTIARASRFSTPVSGKVVEGIFDGQNMVDSAGQTYPVPANYASKSKLVEGDGMKLTITDEGKFIYKQIAPTDRRTTKGVLIQEDGQYKVLADGKAYRVLLASVTFYRAEVGDQVTILLPTGEANWGAVEAVIPKSIVEAAAREVVTPETVKEEDGELSPSVEDAPKPKRKKKAE
jgi:hypothetical protein